MTLLREPSPLPLPPTTAQTAKRILPTGKRRRGMVLSWSPDGSEANQTTTTNPRVGGTI